MTGNRLYPVGVALVLAALATTVPAMLPAQRLPSLVLHHLRVGLDSATWRDVQQSPFLGHEFAARDSIVFDASGARWMRQLFMGRRQWLELVQGNGTGSIELGLTAEAAGSTPDLVEAWRRKRVVLDSSTVLRGTGDGTEPWYLRWAVMAGKGAMLGVELDSYHPALFRRLAERDSLPADVMDRARAMQPHFAPDRLFAEITGATLAIPVEEIHRLRAALISGGAVAVVDEGEGLVVVLEDGLRLRLVPAWERPGIQRLEFYLTRSVPANPSYRLGPRSRFRFGPGRVAVWDFDLP